MIYINILVDWSLSGITRHPLIWIASACGLVDSDFTNDEFLGLYPILMFGGHGWLTWIFIQYSARLPLCVAIWISIVKNRDAPSKHWKEGGRLVITRLYSMWLLPCSNAMIKSQPPCISSGDMGMTMTKHCFFFTLQF